MTTRKIVLIPGIMMEEIETWLEEDLSIGLYSEVTVEECITRMREVLAMASPTCEIEALSLTFEEDYDDDGNKYHRPELYARVNKKIRRMMNKREYGQKIFYEYGRTDNVEVNKSLGPKYMRPRRGIYGMSYTEGIDYEKIATDYINGQLDLFIYKDD